MRKLVLPPLAPTLSRTVSHTQQLLYDTEQQFTNKKTFRKVATMIDSVFVHYGIKNGSILFQLYHVIGPTIMEYRVAVAISSQLWCDISTFDPAMIDMTPALANIASALA